MQATAHGALILKSSSHHVVTFGASEVIASQHSLKGKRLHKPGDNCKRRVLAANLHDTYQPLSPITPLAGRIPKRSNLQRAREIAQSVKCLLPKHERPYFHLQDSC